LPLATTTRVSSGWIASISIRRVIQILSGTRPPGQAPLQAGRRAVFGIVSRNAQGKAARPIKRPRSARTRIGWDGVCRTTRQNPLRDIVFVGVPDQGHGFTLRFFE